MHKAQWLLVAIASVLMSGCSLPRLIDSDVNSFRGKAGAVSGVGYRFERLPSQAQQDARQTQIEGMAAVALARAGLTRDKEPIRYAVQLGLQTDTLVHNTSERALRGGYFLPNGTYIRRPLAMPDPPWYRFKVSMLLRDTSNGQLAYETHAVHEGPWSDIGNLLPPILEAALRDFPNPPAGQRKVVIELPGDSRP